MLHRITSFLKEELGQDLAEYGLIIGLIAVVCIGSLSLLGGCMSRGLLDVAGAL